MARIKQQYEKLFYDLKAAKAFGEAIDTVAREITVPAGSVGKPYRIFQGPYIGCYEAQGNYFYIKRDVDLTKERFYVGYYIDSPRGSTFGDMIKAKRQADTYLDQKYQELTGSSLER